MKLRIVLASAAFISHATLLSQEANFDSIAIRKIYKQKMNRSECYTIDDQLKSSSGISYLSAEAFQKRSVTAQNEVSSKTGNQLPKKAPYSPTRTANGFTFLSGQIGVSPVTNKLIKSPFPDQAGQVFQNIQDLLKTEGLGMQDVIDVTIYLTDISNYEPMNAVFANYFVAPYPTRVCVEVKSLPGKADIEVAVLAINKNE